MCTWRESTGQDYVRGVTSSVEIPNISEFWGVRTRDGLRWDLNPLPTFSWGWYFFLFLHRPWLYDKVLPANIWAREIIPLHPVVSHDICLDKSVAAYSIQNSTRARVAKTRKLSSKITRWAKKQTGHRLVQGLTANHSAIKRTRWCTLITEQRFGLLFSPTAVKYTYSQLYVSLLEHALVA